MGEYKLYIRGGGDVAHTRREDIVAETSQKKSKNQPSQAKPSHKAMVFSTRWRGKGWWVHRTPCYKDIWGWGCAVVSRVIVVREAGMLTLKPAPPASSYPLHPLYSCSPSF
jgi:hypothetical protein